MDTEQMVTAMRYTAGEVESEPVLVDTKNNGGIVALTLDDGERLEFVRSELEGAIRESERVRFDATHRFSKSLHDETVPFSPPKAA